ncbi:hypothetical protein ANANG_G00017940 [Anguilla anguilla]|uniref:S-adenosylmethionine-dependent nucleotide dehydratase RSAD2 n=2 Tax=Anguilla anguilla TaxID=7936 RepID=A0A9D3S6Z0_ANGAN|nr:hypothetical protein ANANG_G00017940 [Anguilla anguilla]
MLLSSQIVFVKMMLQVCITNLHIIFLGAFDRVFSWMGANVGQGRAARVAHKADKSEPVTLKSPTPSSVNYHFTRQCNYKCGFCFHTAKTSFVLPIEEAKRGLSLLKESGMEKINFSGGEPFLQEKGDFVGKLVQFCKQDLQLPSVSIVSNGSLIRESWFRKYGEYLDIIAISCDSFDEDTNKLIGRTQGRKSHLDNLYRVRSWCKEYKVAFKINSVINSFNVEEDMREQILELSPVRWKVFQCLVIEGENAGENALREAERFVISDQQFQDFLDRHNDITCLVPESNQKMRDSYLILDEYMRFLDCREGRKDPSKSILDVGVENAIQFSGFDEKMFLKRGGKGSAFRFLSVSRIAVGLLVAFKLKTERKHCWINGVFFRAGVAVQLILLTQWDFQVFLTFEGEGNKAFGSRGAASLLVRCRRTVCTMTTARYRPTCDLALDPLVSCKLCLGEFPLEQMTTISQCQCVFCTLCLKQYVELLIKEGLETAISCPDSACPKRGHLQETEIECMVATEIMQKYRKLQFEKEVLLDPCRTWCPSSTCQAVCQLKETDAALPQRVQCAVCSLEFCSACKIRWHPGQACQENQPITAFLPGETSSFYKADEDDAPIKRCPKCKVYIERDEGCAQMMCKNCKHAFCWYCLESLDDDFLLIHYDKGPCRNKLGHSRASVIWHRTQVVGIFAGFGLLLLVASPFLLLATPFVLCCKCKCSKGDDDPLPT